MWDIKRPTYDPVRLDDDVPTDIESSLSLQNPEHLSLTTGIDISSKSRTQKRTRYVIASTIFVSLILLAIAMVYNSSSFSSEKYPRCLNPEKRLEWRDMNTTEQTEYIEAVKCLQQFPAQLFNIGRLSDDFPWLHRHVARESESSFPSFLLLIPQGIYLPAYLPLGVLKPRKIFADRIQKVHNSAMFLPYHRYFIHLYHTALREKCRYHGTIPYVFLSPLSLSHTHTLFPSFNI